MAAITFVPRFEEAFLGYNCRTPAVLFSFDGRRLVCWEAWWPRAGAIVAGAFVGPGLTVALLAGIVKPLPWLALAVVVVLNVIAWLGWIDALRHRYQIAVDVVSGEIQFFFHPRGAPVFTMKLNQVKTVEVVVIKRSKRASVKPPMPEMIERYGIATIDCYNLVLALDDGCRVYLLETTDRTVPEELRRLLQESLATAEK